MHQKTFAIVRIRIAKPRRLLREKRLARIGLRCPPELKIRFEKRASRKDTTLSKHILNLAVCDLEKQLQSGRTLFDTAGALASALELASQGIENDQQRLLILRRLTKFQAALLEETA